MVEAVSKLLGLNEFNFIRFINWFICVCVGKLERAWKQEIRVASD